MLTVVFSGTKIWVSSILPEKTTMSSSMFVSTVVQELEKEIDESELELPTLLYLHFDNAPPHKARFTKEEVAKLNFTLLAHPPYSPDLAPCDFFLF
jgi:histone-lysine N-methyltransferase SETMAR